MREPLFTFKVRRLGAGRIDPDELTALEYLVNAVWEERYRYTISYDNTVFPGWINFECWR